MLIIMTFEYAIWLIEYFEDSRTARAVCRIGDTRIHKYTLHQGLMVEIINPNTKTASMNKKVKDLKKGSKLNGLKLRSPKGVIGYYMGQGNNVIYLGITPEPIKPVEGKKDETRLYPQIVEKQEDIMDWDVIENKDIRVNCGDLTSHKYTMCVKTK